MGELPQSAKRSKTAEQETEDLLKETSEPPKTETARKYTWWGYPSQVEKLRNAAESYKKRHPRAPKLTVAELIRSGVDQIPEDEQALDEYVHSIRN